MTNYDANGRAFTCGERVRLAGRENQLGRVVSLDSAGVWVVRPDRPRACFCYQGGTLVILDDDAYATGGE